MYRLLLHETYIRLEGIFVQHSNVFTCRLLIFKFGSIVHSDGTISLLLQQ